jgi:hypothetical protein
VCCASQSNSCLIAGLLSVKLIDDDCAVHVLVQAIREAAAEYIERRKLESTVSAILDEVVAEVALQQAKSALRKARVSHELLQ